jgi:glycosyltransferase involved in cell wall biosynthesis
VRWLSRGDIAVSTAAQENFGYAVLEAMAAGALPLVPDRLSYPEILPASLRAKLLYPSEPALAERLEGWLRDPARWTGLRAPAMRAARRHAWSERVKPLDAWVASSGRRA